MNRARMLLWPASLLYGLGARVRGWAYRRGWFSQRRLQKPVICVGNLTIGGTGKTPMVIWIAQRFAEQGQRVGILTRGYKGVRVGGLGERGGLKVGEIRSDEARLMESRLPQEFARIAVGADRFASGSKLEPWADYFVLDDGLQHLQLARDVNIVLIDALEPFGGGQLLPAGNLREPKTALRRADVVVITRSSALAGDRNGGAAIQPVAYFLCHREDGGAPTLPPRCARRHRLADCGRPEILCVLRNRESAGIHRRSPSRGDSGGGALLFSRPPSIFPSGHAAFGKGGECRGSGRSAVH